MHDPGPGECHLGHGFGVDPGEERSPGNHSWVRPVHAVDIRVDFADPRSVPGGQCDRRDVRSTPAQSDGFTFRTQCLNPETTATRPAFSLFRSGSGSTSETNPEPWQPTARNPACAPEMDSARTPRFRRVMANRAADSASPAARSLSISRRSGIRLKPSAESTSSSVLFPRADTTTTSDTPFQCSCATCSATEATCWSVVSELPPYFRMAISIPLRPRCSSASGTQFPCT